MNNLETTLAGLLAACYIVVLLVLKWKWPQLRSPWLTAGGVALLLVTLAAGALLYILQTPYHSDAQFSATAWHRAPDRRYEMTESLLASKRLLGLSRRQVLMLLGDPALVNTDFHDASDDSTLVYSIGCIPGLTKDRTDIMVIHFNKKKRVTSIAQ